METKLTEQQEKVLVLAAQLKAAISIVTNSYSESETASRLIDEALDVVELLIESDNQ